MNIDVAKDWNAHAQQGGPNRVREVFSQGLTDDLDSLEPDRRSGLVITRASEIKPEKVRWLWEHRIPLGKCTLIAGEGGLGKSMVLAWIAATVSRGGEWPCAEGRSPRGSTIILSAEDDAADTIVPRLMAADADRYMIHIVPAVRREDEKGRRSFNLHRTGKEDQRAWGCAARHHRPNHELSRQGRFPQECRAAIRARTAREMAARLGVAVIANTHFSKAAGGSANRPNLGPEKTKSLKGIGYYAIVQFAARALSG
jgi:hypothetical protein